MTSNINITFNISNSHISGDYIYLSKDIRHSYMKGYIVHLHATFNVEFPNNLVIQYAHINSTLYKSRKTISLCGPRVGRNVTLEGLL